ncbi:MAG: HAMP domain-containing sensor histidine kinase [Thermoflexaceae bacterium]|nr:HAMP domain-containing sensor histidine kinase [Thermoflexaceae bacterium]
MLKYEDYQKINELRETNKEVYDLIRKITDFALKSASLGCHDLRNHAGLISSYCQLITMTDPSMAQNPYFQKIELSSGNLIQLFDEIAQFRYSFTNGDLCEKSIKEILKKTIRTTREKFSELTLTITLKDTIPAEQSLLWCNADHICSAFCAILTNCVEACPPDSVNITIQSSVSGNFMEVCIADTGHGFSEEMLEKAALPFETDKKNHSGLGLSIASTVIYKHNGNLKFSNTSAGSQVTILLPLQNYLPN